MSTSDSRKTSLGPSPMSPPSIASSGEPMDDEEFEVVQEWRTSIPNVANYNDRDKIEGIRDNVEYILRRHPFFMQPKDFANANLYLRPEYGTPSFEWDMVDIVDLTCEIQNKMNIEISDDTMYLDFIQLKDVYNYLYLLKPGGAPPAASLDRSRGSLSTGPPTPATARMTQKVDKGKEEAHVERTMLCFPGQGAQKVGMGMGLDQQYPEVRDMFTKAAEVLGYDLLSICLKGPEEKLNSTLVSQPAIFVVSLAAVVKMRKEDPERAKNCVVTAGLSLGEYTALVFAGVLTFEDGLRLVKARAEAMQAAADAAKSGMVSVLGTNLSENKVYELAAAVSKSTNSRCTVANLLCPGNVVVSGSEEACEEVMKRAESFGATKAVRLNVAGAFHSEFMRPAYAALSEALQKVKFNPPRVPVLFNVDAEAESDPEKIRNKLLEQLVKPVLWERTMNAALRTHHLVHVIEVGPGNVLTGILRRILKTADPTIKARPSAFSV